MQVPLKPNSCNIVNPEKPERGTACCKYLGAMLENQTAIYVVHTEDLPCTMHTFQTYQFG